MFSYLFTVRGSWSKTPLSCLSAFPCFFGCPHFCGNLPTSAMTSVVVWAPSLLQAAPHFYMCFLTSVVISSRWGVSPLPWAPSLSRFCLSQCLLRLRRPGTPRGADFVLGNHWQSDGHSLPDSPVPSLVVTCSGSSPSPTISASRF